MKAVFKGYQRAFEKGHFIYYPIYNIINGEHKGDTLSYKSLIEFGIEIPYTPPIFTF